MNQRMGVAEKVGMVLTDIERRYTPTPFVSAVCAAFVLYVAHETPELTNLEEILAANKVPQKVSREIVKRLAGHWERYLPLLTAFSRADLKSYLSSAVDGEHLDGCRSGVYSSRPIVDLAVRLLGLKKGDSVCDLGCAAGDFLCRAYEVARTEAGDTVCAGFEIDEGVAAVAAIRMLSDGLDVSIRGESVFVQKHLRVKFDKVFCDAPLAERGLAQKTEERAFVQNTFPDFPELNVNMTGGWLFAARAVAAMKEVGRAAVVLSPSEMFDGRHAPYRRYFIQRGFVEAVIELPPRIFSQTNIAPYLVVFSAGNEAVQMVRAGELCYSSRKRNVIGAAHVETIAACLGLTATCGSEGLDAYRVRVAKDDLLAGDCDLTVARHFAEPEPDGDTVPFGALIADSKRGFSISSRELDALVSDEETPYLYLSPGDINEGVLAADLTKLGELPKDGEAFLAKRGDLVITRVMSSGATFKTAVVEAADGKEILPNGNLLVMTVDVEKTDPYFIKAWLDGAFAQKYLATYSVGAAARTLSMKTLEELPVPALPLERQKEIGAACREAVRRFVRLRDELREAKAALPRVFEECAGGL